MIDGDGVLSWRELLFLGVFAFQLFVVPILVVWRTYVPEDRSRFDLRSLWTYNGQIDKFAVILMGTWWIHASSMVLWTLTGKVATADYVTFMGWAVPILAKMFSPAASASSGAAPVVIPPAKP